MGNALGLPTSHSTRRRIKSAPSESKNGRHLRANSHASSANRLAGTLQAPRRAQPEHPQMPLPARSDVPSSGRPPTRPMPVIAHAQ